MEIQNHSDQNVRPELSDEDINSLVKANPTKSYPIRMLHLSTGSLIVGFVISVLPDTIMVLRPHVLQVAGERNHEGDFNIEFYEMVPYLNQLVEYDPEELDATPFMTSNVISLNIPAPHVRRNYTSITQMKQQYHSEDDDTVLYREYPSKDTLH